MTAIAKDSHFVMAGSMDSFNAPFVPLFDLAVHITADAEIRLARIRKREYKTFGDRIMPGGDMYEDHQRFLESAARYDTDGSPNIETHMQWAATLPCRVIFLNGTDDLCKNTQKIVDEYYKYALNPCIPFSVFNEI